MARLRAGLAEKGAAWLQEELAAKAALQLRALARQLGVPQTAGGINLAKAQLADSVLQKLTEQARLQFWKDVLVIGGFVSRFYARCVCFLHCNAPLCAGGAGHQRGEKHLVTCHPEVFPSPAIENAKPFAVEADGAPGVLVVRVLQDCHTDMMTLHVEWMARAPEHVARTFTEKIVWSLLDAQPPEVAGNKRASGFLVAETPSKAKRSSWCT